MIEEFKNFSYKGNAFDLAIGVIMGAAFGKIVSSLVDDLIMPIAGLATGGVDFTNKFVQRIEKGKGEVLIDGKRTRIKSDHAILVPAGARHNVVNTGKKPLMLYTLYGPPEHKDGITRTTKADAEATAEHFDGKTTETDAS